MLLASWPALFCVAISLVQQSTSKAVPEFDAASIKLNTSGSEAGAFNTSPGRVSVQNLPLNRVIQIAFDMYQDALFSGPPWLNSERFDVEAKASGPAPDNELLRMLQSLLTERFHLTFHTEKREMPVLALIPAQGGLKAQQVDPKDPSPGPKATMPHFAARLSNMRFLNLGRPIVDMTGFEGEFKYGFSFNVDTTDSVELQSRLMTALGEQLGLRLEPRKASVGVMVIDHIDKLPAAN